MAVHDYDEMESGQIRSSGPSD